ncbi:MULTISPECIES: cyclin-dependent kinase inhibitor 3 family protein [Stenotrophomonas]|uniref:cyclin-dependent kinase inhibitor 3 family protein n=1 Tax=Stenotrophomonas TaxID=40323 RepID=UPI000A502E16|nr:MULTISPECIES: cyclin-dependent kinase inhibitor 3 family protein [Stenotrophomonas]MCR1818408.1 cyclin-dependent kinase inhibitor 3 family protein [Stenotrophomonas muris]MDG9975000.1 cyclin-dependent kinase inhibitor 3 family protein [Stenotrophomonas sp. GD04032]
MLVQIQTVPLGSQLDIQIKRAQRLIPARTGHSLRRAFVSRTSVSHPLKIATLPVGINGGGIGVTFAPGKHQAVAMTGSWSRDLNVDLASIVDWGAKLLLTLIEPWEFEELQITSLEERAKAHGLIWHGLPITDGAAPDARLLEPWRSLGPKLASELLSGTRIVVHCKGGLGRAGTVASMLLLETGCASDGSDAIAKVRSVRPGAVETPEQEKFILNWSAHRIPGLG